MRVFLGIDLPADLKSKIHWLAINNHLNCLPIKLVEQENFHLAIKFLAELSHEQINEVAHKIADLAKKQTTVKAQIKDTLVFPNLDYPKVLALKVISPELTIFGEKIIQELDGLPFVLPENRRYTPHLTLGRIKSNLSELEKEMIQTIKFESDLTIDSIQFFSSQLTATGPIYSIIKEFKLNG